MAIPVVPYAASMPRKAALWPRRASRIYDTRKLVRTSETDVREAAFSCGMAAPRKFSPDVACRDVVAVRAIQKFAAVGEMVAAPKKAGLTCGQPRLAFSYAVALVCLERRPLRVGETCAIGATAVKNVYGKSATAFGGIRRLT